MFFRSSKEIRNVRNIKSETYEGVTKMSKKYDPFGKDALLFEQVCWLQPLHQAH